MQRYQKKKKEESSPLVSTVFIRIVSFRNAQSFPCMNSGSHSSATPWCATSGSVLGHSPLPSNLRDISVVTVSWRDPLRLPSCCGRLDCWLCSLTSAVTLFYPRRGNKTKSWVFSLFVDEMLLLLFRCCTLFACVVCMLARVDIILLLLKFSVCFKIGITNSQFSQTCSRAACPDDTSLLHTGVCLLFFLACADDIVPFYTTPHATACIYPSLCSSSSLWSHWIPVPAVSGTAVPAVLLCGRSSTRFKSVWPPQHQKGEQLAKFKEVGGPLYE